MIPSKKEHRSSERWVWKNGGDFIKIAWDGISRCWLKGLTQRTKDFMTGAAENYLPFVFPRDDSLKGRIVRTLAKRISGNKVLGEMLEPD